MTKRAMLMIVMGICVMTTIAGVIYWKSHAANQASAQPIVRTDSGPLAQRFPFLGTPVQSSWTTKTKGSNSDRELPAPTDLSISGYVRLATGKADELAKQYKWLNDTNFHPGFSSPFGPANGKILKSDGLQQFTLPHPFSGTIWLIPNDNAVYLEVIQF